MNKPNKKDIYRGRYWSIVIQPNKEVSENWLSITRIGKETEELMNSGFPIHTEIIYLLKKLKAENVNKTKDGKKQDVYPERFVGQGETGSKNGLPHYQIYLEYPIVVRRAKIINAMKKFSKNRCHIMVNKVYTDEYALYCVKETDKFQFESPYYWNDIFGDELTYDKVLKLRPKLKKVKENPFSSQKLLRKIITSTPDDRSIYAIVDGIGGTGKTAGLQCLLDDPKYKILYIKVTDGIERLYGKFDKLYRSYLQTNGDPPKILWINLGRTTSEKEMKNFSSFAEDLVDGMIDHNFGNSGTGKTLILPYLNIILTTNIPPSVKNLTLDRWHILSTYPILDDESKQVSDVVMIPTYLNIKMILHPRTENQLVKVTHEQRMSESKYYIPEYSDMPYYSELEKNISIYNCYIKNCINEKKYYKPMEAPWRTRWVKDLQEGEREVYEYGMQNPLFIGGEDDMKLKRLPIEVTSFDVMKNSKPQPIGEKINRSKTQKTI